MSEWFAVLPVVVKEPATPTRTDETEQTPRSESGGSPTEETPAGE